MKLHFEISIEDTPLTLKFDSLANFDKILPTFVKGKKKKQKAEELAKSLIQITTEIINLV